MKNAPRNKMWFFSLILGAAFAGLGYRLVDVQVLNHEKYRMQAKANTYSSYYRLPQRGDIRDIKGNLLATSKVVKTVFADPTLISNKYVLNRTVEVAGVLAPLLQMNQQELVKMLEPKMITNKGRLVPDQYVVLKKKVRLEDWEKIQSGLAKMPLNVDPKKLDSFQKQYYNALRTQAISSEDDQLREYPNKTQASHILGYVGLVEKQINQKTVIEMEGKDGIERICNQALTGVKGWRETEHDIKQHELVVFRDQDIPSKPGMNVILTLDLGVQNIVESELIQAMEDHQPISASAIVVRPKTGELVALASLPNYDPNNPGAYSEFARKNRIVCDIAEPGSTFKIVVISGGLNEKIVSLSDVFDCENGSFFYAGKMLHDHEKYGRLTVEQIITKSSNIGSAKIGILLGKQRLYNYVKNFGFGTTTMSAIPGEMPGMIAPPEKWSKLSISRIPMGHEIASTALQVVYAMSAIANGGRLMRPILVDRIEDEKGNIVMQYKPEVVRQACSPDAANLMVRALKTVVSTNGTASKAKLDNYVVAGKTGTANKTDGYTYLKGKYYSSFIGFFPADNPEICISVVLDEPHNGHYGGQTAAPIFKRIAERTANYLRIKPDMMIEEGKTNSLQNSVLLHKTNKMAGPIKTRMKS